MKIQRLVLVGDDKSKTVTKEKILTIPIKPGIPTGTRIVFPEEGDQGPTKIPGKLSITVRTKKQYFNFVLKHFCPILTNYEIKL